MPHRVRAALVPAILVLVVPVLALAWQEPVAWPAVGDVASWTSLDAMFYRLRDDAVFIDRSQDKVNQQAAYERTRQYGGDLDGIGLEAWLALPADQQAERTRLAGQQLDFVIRFRQRIETLAQRTRQNEVSGWGTQVADVTVVGDCLQKLRTAVGLDPANPYAWHLYSWFAAAVGDRDRVAGALAGAEAALSQVPADALLDLRRGVALDGAWLALEQGSMDRAARLVAAAAALEADIFQVTLLQGLLAARLGDQESAFHYAGTLRQTAIRRFPEDYRTSGSAPELNNVAVWTAVPSDYAERWIKALSWIQAGQLDMAAKAFGTYRFDDIYPQAHRFWNDAGMIYELTGRTKLAATAWDQARVCRPFAPYFPYKRYNHDVGRLTGRPGELTIYLGFDTFYVTGSRLAYAAGLADLVDQASDDGERQDRAVVALEELDICLARSEYPAQAALLKGAVYHRLGDLAGAVVEVEEALRLIDAQGDGPGYQAVLDQLAEVRVGRSPSELAAFFGQSGSTRSRWASVQDADARREALRAAYAADPTDANRQALARFLIRTGDTAGGRALVADHQGAADVVLTLEADRSLGDTTLARRLADDYLASGADPWNDPGLWAMVGFMCLDDGADEAGWAALERALELDPGNHGLKIQLQLMKAAQGG